MNMGASIFILVGLLGLGALVTACSAAVCSKAGFDDWGNYAAFGPFLALLMLRAMALTEPLRALVPAVALIVLPLGYFATLILLALRRWPGPAPKAEEGA